MHKIQTAVLLLMLFAGSGTIGFWLGRQNHSQETAVKNVPGSPQSLGSKKGETNTTANPRKSFSWQEIETDDYRLYIDNLRTIGCPEPTVADIVVADVNALYMAKAKPLLQDLKASLVRYYTNATHKPDKNQILAEAGSKLDVFNAERLGLISKLLGHELEKFKTATAPWTYAVNEMTSDPFPYLSPEKSSQLAQLKKAAQEKVRSRLPPGRSFTKEDLQFLDEVTRSTESDISKLLTPEEFEDYLVNNSDEATDLRIKLSSLTVSDDEFRTLLKGKRELDDKYGHYFTAPSLLSERQAAEQQLSTKMNDVLGADRYKEYLMDNSPAFQGVASFSQDTSLSSQQAIDLFNFGIQTQLTVRSAMTSAASPDAFRQQVAAILQAADNQLAQLLNDNTRSAYLQSPAGNWLNRLHSGDLPPVGGGGARAVIGGPR